MYMHLKPQLKVTAKHNQEIEEYNKELQGKNNELQSINQTLREKKEEITAAIYESQNSLDILQSQADQAAQVFYDKSLALAQEKFAAAADKERKKYLQTMQEYQEELEKAMREGAEAYSVSIEESSARCAALMQQFTQLQNTTNAAVEAAKRAAAIKQEADFYKIQLSELDKEEIRILKNIAPYLRDREPLNKVIWKVYYEKPTTDLIGRVLGSEVHTGIYKITNLENQMCYVGQAVNLAERWKQHIKRGLGAEAPTKNKLYPAMIAFGVENFSFEMIEECPREKLDEREDYWQEYFKAKEFGYSIK